MIPRVSPQRGASIGRHPTSRVTALVRGLVLCSAVIACTNQEQRCRSAQTHAQDAWGAYLHALHEREATLRARQADVQQRTRKVARRIDAIASEEAHRLYDPGAAWQRQYEVSRLQACRRDAECDGLERDRERLEAEAATLQTRIAIVTGARNQALAAPAQAWSAARAVEADANDARFAAAASAASDAADACDVATNTP